MTGRKTSINLLTHERKLAQHTQIKALLYGDAASLLRRRIESLGQRQAEGGRGGGGGGAGGPGEGGSGKGGDENEIPKGFTK